MSKTRRRCAYRSSEILDSWRSYKRFGDFTDNFIFSRWKYIVLKNDLFLQTQPELATAAQSDPARFAELLRHTRERQYNAALAQQREIEHLNADPFNVEAQRRIEEAIRQQAVLENMEHAIEYSPEAFGRVTML